MTIASQTRDDMILVFDGGTQSIRCGLVDLAGTILDFIKIPITPYFSEKPGFAEQYPQYFWDKFCEASHLLLARNSDRIANIKAVTVTTQRGVYINLDRDGKALRPAISWLDQRQASKKRWAPFWLEWGLKLVGLYGTVDKLNQKCFSNWIKEYQPEIWSKTHKYVLLSGYFHHQLTGAFAESLGSNFGYMPVDLQTFGWAKNNDIIWYVFPIEKEKLPDLVPQGGTLGMITRQASQDTGIPEGIPVVASSCDKSCEVLGAGCLSSEVGCLSFGTCATVNAVTDKKIDLLPYLPPYPAAMPRHFVTEIPIDRGFWMVSWFLEEFGLKERMQAQQLGVSPESLLDDLIKDIPPGSNGLMLQPYWSPDRVYCDEFGRGTIIGFSDTHTRAHLYRSIIEGLIYALKDGATITTDKLKQPFQKLRVSGGGAQSKIALQIAADVFGLTVECLNVSETSVLGAAIIAAVGMGYYPDYASAVQGMSRISQTVQPDPKNQDLYAELYQQVYRKIYQQNKPIYRVLAKILARFTR